MRVVFMGTPEFAVPSLEAVASHADVVGVFTRPDAVSGRGRSTHPSPVAEAASRLGVELYRLASLKDEAAAVELVGLAPDLLVVAAYGLILPPNILEIPSRGCVNVHASLLPRWRGAAPVQRAILAGDAEVGVSIMRMEAGLDTGPYCLQKSMPVGDADAVALTRALARLGAEALVEALPALAGDTVTWTPQDESRVTYADKISKDDVAISAEMLSELALRRIRAASHAAPCRVIIAGRHVTLLEARLADPLIDAAPAPGGVAGSRLGVLLGIEDGALLVTRLKPDGKGAMAASDWARGVRDLAASTWDTLR